jgi:hypothetical protein
LGFDKEDALGIYLIIDEPMGYPTMVAEEPIG